MNPQSTYPSVDEMTDILPLEGALELAGPPTWFYMALVLVSVVFAYLVYQLIKKYLPKRSDRQQKPDDKVYQDLKELKNNKTSFSQQQYYFKLSEIFRQYLEDRFDYAAIDKTSEEIIPDLKSQLGLSLHLAQTAESFLTQSDLVKFTNLQKSEEDILKDEQMIVDFVSQTKPIIEKQ